MNEKARPLLIALLASCVLSPQALAQERPPRQERPERTERPPPAEKVPASTGGEDDPRARAAENRHVREGDYYMKADYPLKAVESYRVAVLEDPDNPWKKLSFGHALFALGNYSYASYALRRAVDKLDASAPFEPRVVSLFPSRKRFDKALSELKHYVEICPRDPAGLSVLGYMLYASNADDALASEVLGCLQKLPSNANDRFARFLQKQIELRKAIGQGTAIPVEPPRVDVVPRPTPKPAPPPPGPGPTEEKPKAPPPLPDVKRFDERTAKHAPGPASAVAE